MADTALAAGVMDGAADARKRHVARTPCTHPIVVVDTATRLRTRGGRAGGMPSTMWVPCGCGFSEPPPWLATASTGVRRRTGWGWRMRDTDRRDTQTVFVVPVALIPE